MGILSRLAKVLESNVNALLDRAEDPAKILDQAILDMKRGREDARRALIEAKTAQRMAKRRQEQALNESEQLEARALDALELGSEDRARSWVDQKLAAEDRAEAEASAYCEHQAQIEQLEIAERELARRLQALPARRAALLARQATAEARGVYGSKGLHETDTVAHALEAFERMESRVISAEVEAEVRAEDASLDFLGGGTWATRRNTDAFEALRQKSNRQLAEPGPKNSEVSSIDSADTLAKLKEKLTVS